MWGLILVATAIIVAVAVIAGAIGGFSLRDILPDLSALGLPSLKKKSAIEEATTEIETQTATIKGITADIKQMQEEFAEQFVEIGAGLTEVERLAEESVAREQMYADAYQLAVERETKEAIESATQSSEALTRLYQNDPATMEWLVRMGYLAHYE